MLNETNPNFLLQQICSELLILTPWDFAVTWLRADAKSHMLAVDIATNSIIKLAVKTKPAVRIRPARNKNEYIDH